MSRFNPTDKLALPNPALHLYWPPAQRQALGSSMCQSNTHTAYPGGRFRDRRDRAPCGYYPSTPKSYLYKKRINCHNLWWTATWIEKGLVNYSLISGGSGMWNLSCFLRSHIVLNLSSQNSGNLFKEGASYSLHRVEIWVCFYLVWHTW